MMRVLNPRGGPRLVAAGSSVLLAASGLLLTSVVSAAPASASVGQVAPYVDMSNSQEGVLNTVISSDGLRSFTAAFAIGEGCSDIWGDTLPVGSDPTIGGEISSAKAAGASVIVSSGGSGGEPISFTCTAQSTIDAAYQAIINDYGTSQLDFDIEGAAIADTAGIDRTFQAMKDLKAADPGLAWSVTIPVLPTGLDSNGTALLQDAQNMGVTIPLVNIMAMDYYQGDIEMGNAAISAAENTLSQMRAVNGSYSYANVGITPMIGVKLGQQQRHRPARVLVGRPRPGLPRRQRRRGLAHLQRRIREHRPVHRRVHRRRRRNPPASNRRTLRRYGGRDPRNGAGG
jgi:hypothetical protein